MHPRSVGTLDGAEKRMGLVGARGATFMCTCLQDQFIKLRALGGPFIKPPALRAVAD
jgi:hypothetical protein